MSNFNNLAVMYQPWTTLKSTRAARHLPLQYEDNGIIYTIFALDESLVFVCVIYKGSVPDSPGFDQAQNDADKTDFETNYKAKANKSLIHRTADGKDVVSVWPTEGSKSNLISHNWCDKTTWYTNAVRTVDEVATVQNAPANTQYKGSRDMLVDVYHGKITDEDVLKDASGNSYRVIVKVNDVQKVEADPDDGGGDYSINYATGIVTFNIPLAGTDVVKLTYHYASVADYIIKPATGKILKIKSAEVQFADDVVLKDTILFEVMSGNTVLATNTYKTFLDYVNQANGAYPEIITLGLGGGGWRALPRKCITFPWNYQSITDLKSSANMSIRIRMARNRKFDGAYATATFYCLQVDE